MTAYLTVEQLQVWNGENTEAGGTIRDRSVLEAAVHRCQASAFEEDAFETLTLKAAVLLHALASTQGFENGNKRTAWFACEAFLEINGYPLVLDISEVVAEAFVQAVANSLLKLERIEEWLIEHVAPPGGELDFICLAREVELHSWGTWSGRQIHVNAWSSNRFPASLFTYLVWRVFWHESDGDREHVHLIDLIDNEGVAVLGDGVAEVAHRFRPTMGLPSVHHGLWMPQINFSQLKLDFLAPGTFGIRVRREDGQVLAVQPVTITLGADGDVPDSPAALVPLM